MAREGLMAERGVRLVSASELADYVYCARSWKLGQAGYGREASAPALERGSEWHRSHGQRLSASRRLARLGALAVAASVGFIVICLILGLAGR